MKKRKRVEEVKTILGKNIQVLRDVYHVRRIGIYGSYARHEETAKSDVDLLVELDQPVGWEIVDLHHFLERTLGMKVDLITAGAVTRKPRLWQSIQESLIYV
jgi:hypothetical protein